MEGLRCRVCSCPALLAMVALPRRGEAQVLYGSILGDVKDSTEASVPGANVVITNKNTGLTRETVTDTAGHFNFPDVPAGCLPRRSASRASRLFERPRSPSTSTASRASTWRSKLARWARRSPSTRSRRSCRPTPPRCIEICRGGTGEPARPLDRNYQQMFRMLPGFAPPDQLALDPDQPGALAGVHGQRDERRPEQHAHRRRQHGARSVAARRCACCSDRRSSRSP